MFDAVFAPHHAKVWVVFAPHSEGIADPYWYGLIVGGWVPVCLPVCSLICLGFCLLACLPARRSDLFFFSCVSACALACLSACLHVH